MKFTFGAILGVCSALVVNQASAESAIIYDLGGKFDKSFNESAHNGALRYGEASGNSFSEFELQSEAQREQALRRFAQRGHNPIITAGFSFQSVLEVVADDFPDTNFVAIDTVVDRPNVRSVVFREHEGSYLVGILAAMASESGTIGFVGGMDIPFIRRFSCGYVLGARSVNPDVDVIQNMTGTTAAAWNDPVRGGELTKTQISEGADVVYHAAGGTGRGVLQAADDAGILGIGVDSNQNYLHPGSVLTSMVKLVDEAVFAAMSDGDAGGEFSTGIVSLGVDNGGVSYSLDEHNADLISDEMKAAVSAAEAAIVSGDLEVHDFMTTTSCPAS
ncbi:BMP family protein [Ruegeria sp. EL01]|jgi:basic membrane protein A|uniref:BMP family lipoprotein n=1 Tax=Ruegeria sp. EL01 TaxID=2107578 RepID=UPI000EA7F6AF|nr:BMP family ABC transporter substrate-binding protein [Ruegeria sp. EL01]